MLYNIVLTDFNVTERVVSHQFDTNWFIITALCALRLFQDFPNFFRRFFVLPAGEWDLDTPCVETQGTGLNDNLNDNSNYNSNYNSQAGGLSS